MEGKFFSLYSRSTRPAIKKLCGEQIDSDGARGQTLLVLEMDEKVPDIFFAQLIGRTVVMFGQIPFVLLLYLDRSCQPARTSARTGSSSIWAAFQRRLVLGQLS